MHKEGEQPPEGFSPAEEVHRPREDLEPSKIYYQLSDEAIAALARVLQAPISHRYVDDNGRFYTNMQNEHFNLEFFSSLESGPEPDPHWDVYFQKWQRHPLIDLKLQGVTRMDIPGPDFTYVGFVHETDTHFVRFIINATGELSSRIELKNRHR